MGPLVTIGIPTYNRETSLPKALRSALEQNHPSVEVLVSDNASTDGTEQLCRGLPVRYLRLPRNQGPIANFLSALHEAQGQYFMWLADDDWLDANYVSACLAHLEDRPGCALAAGRARYYRDGQPLFTAPAVNVDGESGPARVRRLYAQVQDNFTMHGLGRRADWLRLRWSNVMGSDWLMVAGMAFQGEVVTVESTAIHRDFTWSPTRLEEMARADWLPESHRRQPYLSIARSAAWDIAWRNPIYRSLSWPSRLLLAEQVATLVCRRHQVLETEAYRLAHQYLPPSGLALLKRVRRAWR
jgi:glycosyltransferase involved in cell wall biosynthesis